MTWKDILKQDKLDDLFSPSKKYKQIFFLDRNGSPLGNQSFIENNKNAFSSYFEDLKNHARSNKEIDKIEIKTDNSGDFLVYVYYNSSIETEDGLLLDDYTIPYIPHKNVVDPDDSEYMKILNEEIEKR